MERCDLYWKRLGSADKKEEIICGLGWIWLEWDVKSETQNITSHISGEVY